MLQKVNSRLPSSLQLTELLRATQYAAIGAFSLRGQCDKNAGDAQAVSAMRAVLHSLEHKGIVCIGEGEKDEAPMLYIGEELGLGACIDYEIVVDPLEGTRLLAEGRPNALSVLGIVPVNTISFPRESYYMEKVVFPVEAASSVDITAPLCDIISCVARAIGKSIDEMNIFVLDKPRHKVMIADIIALGARVQLHTDGDIAGSLLAIDPHTDIDMMVGIGGTPEGVLTAVAIQGSGKGCMYARFAPQSALEKEALTNVNCEQWLTAEDIIPTQDVYFLATGVTDGILLEGIHKRVGYYSTHSLAIDGRHRRTFYIHEDIPFSSVSI